MFFNLLDSLRSQEAAVKVELKSGLCVEGHIEAVDQYLNIKLSKAQLSNNANAKVPAPVVAMSSCFIRGSVIRYIDLSSTSIDLKELEGACRKAEPRTETGGNNTGGSGNPMSPTATTSAVAS